MKSFSSLQDDPKAIRCLLLRQDRCLLRQDRCLLLRQDRCLPQAEICLPQTGSCLPQTEICLPQTEICLPKQRSVFSKQRSVWPKQRSVFPKQRSVFSKQRSVCPKHRSALSQHVRGLSFPNSTMFKSQKVGPAPNHQKWFEMGREWSPGPENRPPGMPRPFSRLWDRSRGPGRPRVVPESAQSRPRTPVG